LNFVAFFFVRLTPEPQISGSQLLEIWSAAASADGTYDD